MKKTAALSLLLASILTFRAHALDLSVVATMNFASPSIQTSGTPQATATNAGFGIGILMAVPAFGGFHLETGGLYMTHSYNSGGNQVGLAGIQVPALLRFTGLPFFSLGAGPYVSFPIGNFTSKNLGTSAETSAPIGTTNLSAMDIGLSFALGADIELNPAVKLTADVRYFFAIRNVDANVLDSYKHGGLLILGGLKIAL